jgi:hypothetical protein
LSGCRSDERLQVRRRLKFLPVGVREARRKKKEEGRKEEGGRRKEEGGRRKEEGGRKKEGGTRGRIILVDSFLDRFLVSDKLEDVVGGAAIE